MEHIDTPSHDYYRRIIAAVDAPSVIPPGDYRYNHILFNLGLGNNYPELGLRLALASIFSRGTSELISVNDVVDHRDYDAEETIAARHLVPPGRFRAYEARDEHELLYAANVFTSLQDAAIEQIALSITAAKADCKLDPYFKPNHDECGWSDIPCDVQSAINDLRTKAKRVVLNSAVRNHSAASGKNGNDFYLAVTDNDLEIYACPLSSLAYIRDRVIALFRISSKGHPLYRDGEQFRSSVVGSTAHRAPSHLQIVWDRARGSRDQLNEIIPNVCTDPNVAYIDRFNNRRLWVPDVRAFWDSVQRNAVAGEVQIQVGETPLSCVVAQNLSGIPGGRFGIYCNPADLDSHHAFASGYIELNRRVDDDARIDGTFAEGNVQNASTHLKSDDRRLGVIVRIIPKAANATL